MSLQTLEAQNFSPENRLCSSYSHYSTENQLFPFQCITQMLYRVSFVFFHYCFHIIEANKWFLPHYSLSLFLCGAILVYPVSYWCLKQSCYCFSPVFLDFTLNCIYTLSLFIHKSFIARHSSTRALNTRSFLSPDSLVGWSCRVRCSDLSPVVGCQAYPVWSPSLYRWEGSSFSP